MGLNNAWDRPIGAADHMVIDRHALMGLWGGVWCPLVLSGILLLLVLIN